MRLLTLIGLLSWSRPMPGTTSGTLLFRMWCVGVSWDLITPLSFFSIQWTGFISSPVSGSVTFYVDSDDGVRLYVNDILLINEWESTGAGAYSYAYSIPTANVLYPIVLQYKEQTGSASCVLSWDVGSGKTLIPSTVLYPATAAISGTPATLTVV